MTLKERCQMAARALNENRLAEQSLGRLRLYEERWGRVRTSLEPFRETQRGPAEVFRALGLVASEPLAEVVEARQACGDLAARVRADAALELDGQAFNPVEASLKNAVEALDNMLAISWAQHAADQSPGLSSQDVLRDCDHIEPGIAVAAKRLTSALLKFEHRAEKVPSSAQGIVELRGLASAAAPLVDAYRQATDLPPAVTEFLDGVSRDGAVSLEHVSDEVFQWLRENDRLRLFRVQRK